MGKRKERRLAAMGGGGRRVKLDLFAEPSATGDLGGSSTKDEVGKEVDSKQDAELPNSPSSSGQQVENPLSLLGQYSDDELDERNESTTAPDVFLETDDKKTKLSVGIPLEEGEIGGSEDDVSQKTDNHNLEADSASASASLLGAVDVMCGKVAQNKKCDEVNIGIQDLIPEASDTQTAGCVGFCWKMVLHEESNRYYYWNTVTGETSWEVPDSLVQGTGSAGELEMLETSMKENAAVNMNESSAAFGVKLDEVSTRDFTGYTNGVLDATALYKHGSDANQSVEQCGGAQLLGNFSVAGGLSYGASTRGNYSQCEQLTVSVGHSTVTNVQDAMDLPSHLLRLAESILERLLMLQRSVSDQQGLIYKYYLEVEIRLSDLRSLLPHGSLLGPFWLHSERQLSRLENAINSHIGEHNNGVNGIHLSSAEGKDTKSEGNGEEPTMAADTKSSPEIPCTILHGVNASEVQKMSDDIPSVAQILNLQQDTVQSRPTHECFGEEGDKEINATGPQGKATPKVDFQFGEDVDMDIDMEVEDPSPARIAVDMGGQLVTSSGQLFQANASMTEQSQELESELIIPPPPDEEWIPPPPSDNEGIPPPPPDEPPESCAPSPASGPELVCSIYNEQYNLTFGGSGVPYHNISSTDTPCSSFYEHADGSQVAALTPVIYYGTASSVQPSTMLNPAESVVYYGPQNGVLQIVPQSVDPSGFQASSGLMDYGQLSSELIEAVDTLVEDIPSQKLVEPFVPDTNAGVASGEVNSTSVISAPARVSAKEFVSVPCLSSAVTSVAVTCPTSVASDAPLPSKAKAKASKTKKPKVAVASSMRSNKKVSSLVDKWKAAKEELQEEEEEQRETPLEILEKKRQREIEGWRAQQIASGEAKENANFQPLGGDWRERVKRRRAQKGATVETPSDSTNDSSKQPDLLELSKDLPRGWQAYWDDSSKLVYYSNSISLETTWTRPTR